MFGFLYTSSVAMFILALYNANPYLWVASLILLLITRLWHVDHKELTRIQSTLVQQNSTTILHEGKKAATEFNQTIKLDWLKRIIFLSAFRLGAESILNKLK